MKGFLYIDNDKIGEVEFAILDRSMGVIGGELIAAEPYQQYKAIVQKQCEENGVSNITNFNYRVLFNGIDLISEGGISITDLEELGEIYIEVAGLPDSVVERI